LDIVPQSQYDFTAKTYEQVLFNETTPLFPGVEQMLISLTINNVSWGIVTTKRRRFVEQIISQHACLQSHSVLLCAEDVEEGKPSPEGLLSACVKRNVLPKNAVYIGDLPSDLEAAKRCDMPALWVDWGYHALTIDIQYPSIKKFSTVDALAEHLKQEVSLEIQ
jgi:HAD superfamily hydrolase (TIGR01509 family)